MSTAQVVAPDRAVDALAGIWADLLGVPEVGPADDFFALGGHSVTATRMLARVRALLGVDLPVSTVFEVPTLAGFAERVATAEPVVATAEPAVRDVPALSPTQRLQWFAEQFSQDHSPYTIPLVVRLTGTLDTVALRRAVRDLVARHEVLRTQYPDRDGEPYPVVEPPERCAVGLLRIPADQLDSWLRAQARRAFDLAAEPPLRATICRISSTEHVLAIVLHHIAADGWSRGLILDDIAALYAFHRGLGPALPPATQYAEVACRPTDPGALAADLRWWADRLAGAPSRTTFAGERPRPAALSDAGAGVDLRIDGGLSDQIAAAARSTGTTSYAVCIGALALLLGWRAGETDVVIATSVAGRADLAAESVVGCFINTVAVRIDLSGNPTVRELLRRVSWSTAQSLDHARVSFDQIVRQLDPRRDPAYRPLCQVMLTMHNEPLPHPRLPGLAADWIEVDNAGAKTDVFVDLTDDGGALRGVLTYRTQLYDEPFASGLARQYTALLALLTEVADHADLTIGALRNRLPGGIP